MILENTTPKTHDMTGQFYFKNRKKASGLGRIRTAGLLRVKEPS